MKRGALVAAVAVSLALIGTYVALGGTSFEPTAVADPCLERPERETAGTQESLEQVVFRAADTVACGLGVSREQLVLSLRSVDRLERLADRQGVDRRRARAGAAAGA